VELDGLGNVQKPFDVLDPAFFREFGFYATINLGPITRSQCAAVAFVSRARTSSGTLPHVDIDEDQLTTEGILTGSIAGAGSGNIDLLLVDGDGTVHNFTGALKSDGTTKSFEIRVPPPGDGSAKPQLLIAVAGNAPLPALAKPGTADEVFAGAYAEAREAGHQPAAGVKYLCASVKGCDPR